MQKERYNDFAQFKEKLTRALRLSDVSAGRGPATQAMNDTHIKMCWDLYQNARYNRHGKLVCGLLSDLRDAKRALGGTNAMHDGSVLNIVNAAKTPGAGWTTLANDCWILGGIHAHLPFQLVSNPVGATIKDPNFVTGQSNEDHMMRITARELIGLTHFGYRGCVNPNIDSQSRALGVKYEIRCFDRAKADNATIASYLKAVREQASIMKAHGAMPLRKRITDMLGA